MSTTTATRGRQLNRPAPMTATYAYVPQGDTGGLLYVTVEHGNAQSFSRAVDPRANKEAGRAWRTLNAIGHNIRQVTCTDGAYGHTDPAPGRTRSTIIYTARA